MYLENVGIPQNNAASVGYRPVINPNVDSTRHFYCYKVTNQINGKAYIGFATNPDVRWRNHKSDAKKGRGYLLHRAMRKHGIENFQMEILCCGWSRKDMIEIIEPYLIHHHKTKAPDGYNLLTEVWEVKETTKHRGSAHPRLHKYPQPKPKEKRKKSPQPERAPRVKSTLSAYQQRSLNVKKLYWDLLKSSQCCDCGESDPIVLEFDHIDSSLKVYDVSDVACRSKKKLLEEISRCVVRCANCRRRHRAKIHKWPIVEYLAQASSDK